MFPFQKILCPTDFSGPSLYGLKLANQMAGKFGSEVLLVNVHKSLPKLPSQRIEDAEITLDIAEYERNVAVYARENLTRIRDENLDPDLQTKLIVRRGKPAVEILKVAEEENADVIIIATHGRTGIAHMVFGSVAERVVRLSKVPVLTIHADG